jgi:hypothetical protein
MLFTGNLRLRVRKPSPVLSAFVDDMMQEVVLQVPLHQRE